METRTEFVAWNNAQPAIREMEEAGWAVRQLVHAKQPKPFHSASGTQDGFLVVFEREAQR